MSLSAAHPVLQLMQPTIDVSSNTEYASGIEQALAEEPKHALTDFADGWNAESCYRQQCAGRQHGDGTPYLPSVGYFLRLCRANRGGRYMRFPAVLRIIAHLGLYGENGGNLHLFLWFWG